MSSARSQGLPGSMERRDFLRFVGLGTSALLLQPRRPLMAGPFDRADFDRLVPADKRLRPEWVASLTARGARETFRGPDLDRIGMPVGGIGSGQLYLGGDGRLWHWDIFNRHQGTGAEHYAKPLTPSSPVDQGFRLRLRHGGKWIDRTLDRHHWQDVAFTGEYPIGSVDYSDPGTPVEVRLEAWSPFIPLNTPDSSLPATVLQFTLHNRGTTAIEGELGGWLENATCLHSARTRSGVRRNAITKAPGTLRLECAAIEPPQKAASARPDILFDDFEREAYGDRWRVTGTAFGRGPVAKSAIPSYQGDVSGVGGRVVNSHASAPGDSVGAKDAALGRLESQPFPIERDYIQFLIGGGSHAGRTCVNLLVDGVQVLTATGADNNRMGLTTWDVRSWAGKTATLHIVDNEPGAWGNIGVDQIVFTDQPANSMTPLTREQDHGTMVLALLGSSLQDVGEARRVDSPAAGEGEEAAPPAPAVVELPFGQKLVGGLSRRFRIDPGAFTRVTFVLTWHFPNLRLSKLPAGRHYAERFANATAVADYLGANLPRLERETREWHATWYNSSLPYWFLNRTFLNTSILATSTCFLLGTGRFYAWEGVGCCEGTCGHVWQYAHAMARLFPDLERDLREKVDFGLALQPDGAIYFRGEFNNIAAIDAQAGTILRALREHQMTSDAAWLRRNWPNIRRATEWLIGKDGNGDGLIESAQHNTLDTDWFGPVAWLSSLYLASLAAAAEMADIVRDTTFARRCREILDTGRRQIIDRLFDREYFINRVDSRHLDAINSGTGCHIDQVMGQGWAFQVGLARVLPREQTLSALRSLWRYNFTPDVGPYRDAYKAGRWYAMAGEAGLLMCTFPRSDWDYTQAKGKGPDWAAGYFNECMNGFEYQVASHMVWEGLVTEGLAITRAVHDRYHPAQRNPYNEIECGDHYARSMASYGVFLAACGFEYDGPRGRIAFAPRLTPEDFKAPFTAAEGWGSYSQKRTGRNWTHVLEVKWGRLRITSVGLATTADPQFRSVVVRAGKKRIKASLAPEGDRREIRLATPVILAAGESLQITLGPSA